jgi:hypothetical protein
MVPVEELVRIEKLRRLATQTRVQVLRSELSLAVTFCALAETELAYQQLDVAVNVLWKAQRTATSVRSHIDDLYSLSVIAIEVLVEQLLQLEARIVEVQEQVAAFSENQSRTSSDSIAT